MVKYYCHKVFVTGTVYIYIYIYIDFFSKNVGYTLIYVSNNTLKKICLTQKVIWSFIDTLKLYNMGSDAQTN